MSEQAQLSDLIGKTMVSVTNENDEIRFTTDAGEVYKLFHYQECCESVVVEDVAGELSDLVGVPLLMAEEVSSDPPARGPDDYAQGSETWTFYKFGTIKGYVTIRFYGSSNGYYSEFVSFGRES